MTDSFLSRLSLPALMSASFFARMRSSRTEAGSSSGPCGTSVTRRFVRVINGELISPFMDLRACRSPRTARIERKYGALSDHEKGLKCKNRRGRSRRPHKALGSASVYVGTVRGWSGQPSCWLLTAAMMMSASMACRSCWAPMISASVMRESMMRGLQELML